jgi:L-Ala-D/L-Glu epimerase
MQFRFRRVDWEYVTPFRIAYRTRTHSETVLVEIEDARGRVGRGEALGVSYHGETADTLLAQLAGVAANFRNGLTRTDLPLILPAGGARNALDCALWDLEAKSSGRRVWELLSVSARPLVTAYTLGLDSPDAMARAAASCAGYSLLKLKLSGQDDLERVTAVRRARRDVDLIVDVNQAWSPRQLIELVPHLAALGVKLIEQPLPAGRDDVLADFRSPIPLCADESCQSSDSVERLAGRYEYVNIKLDKTGGLTEALNLARQATAGGLKLMVGCMGGSSLSMAPAFVVGQHCEFVDLDSPLLIKSDRSHAIRYERNRVGVPPRELWG